MTARIDLDSHQAYLKMFLLVDLCSDPGPGTISLLIRAYFSVFAFLIVMASKEKRNQGDCSIRFMISVTTGA